MVISDHGFGPFRRGVDLNRWLEENGYLTVHDGRRGEEHLAGVDWSRTRAFAIGLAGHLTSTSRTSTRKASSTRAARPTGCARRSPSGSTALVDPENGDSAVKRVYIAGEVLPRARTRTTAPT